ncbi:hypothetical protein [Streptomyces mirabilis]|uniref:hypothetical protein n=1 Tax=Streptomyces mirabilis TaxID=68239 RepID=UPI0033B65646
MEGFAQGVNDRAPKVAQATTSAMYGAAAPVDAPALAVGGLRAGGSDTFNITVGGGDPAAFEDAIVKAVTNAKRKKRL